ncbi:hypothetical protein ACGFZ9_06075 [Streptomyces mirabilis]|uniref:hypothetical protein n=1 Tax=Streptomyces mirabilis TaxID=68239 RepID=UPI00371FC0A5
MPSKVAVQAHYSELEALTGHVRSSAMVLTEHLSDWIDAVQQDDLLSLHPSWQASSVIATPSSPA